jgi:hypothetical protein
MERVVQSLKMLWRSERLLRENEFQLGAKKIQCNALAGLVALFGLVMLTLSVFFGLVPYWGQSLAALTVAGGDLLLAGALIAYGRSLQPHAEIGMVKEVRDMALSDIQNEVSLAEAELVALKDDVHKFVRNPMDALLPAAVGPLLGAVTRSLTSTKK